MRSMISLKYMEYRKGQSRSGPRLTSLKCKCFTHTAIDSPQPCKLSIAFSITDLRKSSLRESNLPKVLTAFKWPIKDSPTGQTNSKPGKKYQKLSLLTMAILKFSSHLPRGYTKGYLLIKFCPTL